MTYGSSFLISFLDLFFIFHFGMSFLVGLKWNCRIKFSVVEFMDFFFGKFSIKRFL